MLIEKFITKTFAKDNTTGEIVGVFLHWFKYKYKEDIFECETEDCIKDERDNNGL